MPDVQADAEYRQSIATAFRARSSLGVPMLLDGRVVGVIAVARVELRPFKEAEITLLQTFADQAVIAIENVRLFTELQTSNRDLTTALEQQTATADILRVISSSPTDIQPVFEAIAKSSVRLCKADYGSTNRLEGDVIHLVAQQGQSAQWLETARRLFPHPLTKDLIAGGAMLDREVVHLEDMHSDTRFPTSRTLALTMGYHTALSVPMLRDSGPVGAIVVFRQEGRPFSEAEIGLLRTFADQAVIAIENVRLFTELQEKNRALTTAHAQVTETLEQQTATSDILRVISKSPTDLQPVFDPLLDSAVRLCGATHASLYRLDGDVLHHVAARGAIQGPRPVGMTGPIPHGTAPGRAILTAETVQVMDAQAEVAGMPPDAQDYVRRAGVRTVLAVPLLREGSPIGVIVVRRTEVRPFAENEMRLLRTFADQAVIAIENVRLFKELEVANRELAAASQHKSEFLANMSHELRTPLNAIIGFSEVLTDRMFGGLNEKQDEYLKDIHASGTHLLSLINDILDLSKIEAGRMELELTDFDLPTALDNALTLVRERAGRRSITLQTSIDEQLGEIRADERKIRQVVLNLLSNAIKFTPEGGRIEVGAMPKDGSVEVSVSDTGIGIAPEDQEAVFEEFRQVGTADKKAEGTGLGLTLCRKFIELHGGRIWVKSQVGEGSMFTFTIPVGCGE
jgi:signal transduction histidine kinase